MYPDRVGPIVEQDEEFERRVISLSWYPIRDLIAVAALVNHHILGAYIRHARTITSLDSDQQVRRYSFRTRILGVNPARGAGTQGHPD